MFQIKKEKLRTIFNKRIKKLDMDAQEKDELFERFAELYNHGGFRCAYCNREMELFWGNNELSFTIDHVLARSRGGNDKPNNLLFCCQSCNSMKGDKYLSWFVSNVRKAKERKQKRELWKARKAAKKDKQARDAYKQILEMVRVEKGR